MNVLNITVSLLIWDYYKLSEDNQLQLKSQSEQDVVRFDPNKERNKVDLEHSHNNLVIPL